MIKKTISIIMVLVLVMLIASCGNENKKSDIDYQYYYSKFNGYTIPITKADNGYYLINNNFLYFIDQKNMKGIAVCNKPNCLHNDKDECDAYCPVGNGISEDSCNKLQYYDGNLYILRDKNSQNDEFSGMEFVKIAADASKKKVLYSFKDYSSHWLIHRGYLYYVILNNELKKGDSDTSNRIIIYRINMNSFSGTPEIVYDSKKELNNIIEINVFTAYENYIYLETKQSDESNGGFANKNRTLAINTSKLGVNYVGEKLDYIYTFGFLNGKILAKCRAENYSEKKPSYACYSFDLDGTNQKLEHSLKTGDNLSVDNKYIYLFNNLEVNKKKENKNDNCYGQTITVYDKDWKKVDEFILPFSEWITNLIPQDNKYMIFCEDTHVVGYIDKKQIGSMKGTIAKYNISVETPTIVQKNAFVSSGKKANIKSEALKTLYNKAESKLYKVSEKCNISICNDIQDGFSVKLYWHENGGTCTGDFPIFEFNSEEKAKEFCKQHNETIRNKKTVVYLSANTIPQEVFEMLNSILMSKPINPIEPEQFSGKYHHFIQ